VNQPIPRLLFFGGAAFIPSLLGALSGIGGGIIIKPALDAVYAGGAGEINCLAGCTVLAMSLVSLIQRRREGARLEDPRGIALAAGAVPGGIGGRVLFSLALSGAGAGEERNLRMAQAAILIALTVLVWVSMLRKENRTSRNIGSRVFSALLGCVLGMLSSFLGIGGGPVNIMALSFFLGMDTKTAGYYSLLTIFFSQLASLGHGFFHEGIPALSVSALGTMIAGGILGGLAGSRLLRKLDNRRVDFLFRRVLELVILLSGYNLLRFSLGKH
jgi:uncharacterized membrane protein YfcA